MYIVDDMVFIIVVRHIVASDFATWMVVVGGHPAQYLSPYVLSMLCACVCVFMSTALSGILYLGY